MIEVSVRADASRFKAALKFFGQVALDTETTNRKVAASLHAWVIRNFDGEGGLIGGWTDLKPATIKQKIKAGKERMLVRTGNMRQSFNPFADARVAGVGAQASFNVDYAKAHQYGVPERNLPARPMLPPDEVVREIGLQVYGVTLARAAQQAGLK